MKYKKLLKLLEGRNFTYRAPEDKEELLYDFYMLESLGSPNDIKLKASYDQARKTITDHLQKEMLSALVFAINAEFRYFASGGALDIDDFGNIHMRYDNNSNPIASLTTTGFSNKEKQFIEKYFEEYEVAFRKIGDSHSQKTKTLYGDNKTGYQQAYSTLQRTIKQTNINYKEFIEIAKKAFTNGEWDIGYGEKAWTKIADGWLRLNSAKTLNEKIIAIDHVYDLQHNTDTVFNKLKSYYKDGWDWISSALEHKKHIKDLWEIYKHISINLKPLAAAILKDTKGTTWDLYWKTHGEKNKNRIDFRKILDNPGHYLPYIKDKDIQLAAVSKYSLSIKYIENPTKEMQIIAVKDNPYNIKFIKTPDKDVQLLAIKQNPSVLDYIKNPHPDVLKYDKEH